MAQWAPSGPTRTSIEPAWHSCASLNLQSVTVHAPTTEACGFRDSHAALRKAGAAVLGVSKDPAASHRKFIQKFNLPFPLIADTDKAVAKAFGQTAVVVASRECYVINREGKIVYKDAGVTDQQAANVLAFLATQKK